MFGVDDLVAFGLKLGTDIVDRIFPDPTEAAKAKLELLRMQQTGELAQLASDTDLAKGQLAINQVEAASPSLFVAGWRPGIGWCGVAAIANQFIIAPYFNWFAALAHSTAQMPRPDVTQLLFLIGGMLGFGALRTKEKLAGKADGMQ